MTLSESLDRFSYKNQFETDYDPLETSATTTDISPSPKLRPFESDENRIFAPLSVPLERRLQTLALLWHTCTIPIFISLFFMTLSIPLLWPFVTVYLLRYFIWDKTPNNGQSVYRYNVWMKNLKLWKYYTNYFPIRIHRTLELEPTFTDREVDVLYYRFPFGLLPVVITNALNKYGIIKLHTKTVVKAVKTGPRYIFGSHPHGVISLGITGALATNGAGFNDLFPGIKCFLLTLINQFRIPFYRDYLLSLGISSVSKHNVMSLIRDHDASVCIVVGGASESLLAFPHKNEIVLKKRKGFIKIALELGDVNIVPIFGFGETNIYEVFSPDPKGKFRILYKMQWWMKQNFGFTIPLFYARGVFNYDFGLLPHRLPINIVVGKPIAVPFRPSPSMAEIDYYHELYVEELQNIFNRYKHDFMQPGDQNLRIVQ